MTFEIRLAVLVLAAFASASLAASVVVPWVARRLALARPRSIAVALTTVRLLPVGAGAFAAVVTCLSFLIFEQRDRIETTGVLLQVLAVLTLLFLAAFAGRWYLMTRQTRRLIARWLPAARPITLGAARVPAFVVASDFPVIGVIGVLRPKLIVAQSVLDACSPEEVEAILAHEQAHIDRRDNLWRALMAAPDVLAWLPISRRLQSAWHAATEEAADDCAGRLGQRGRLLLAQALVKVARLAVTRIEPGDLPATALYRGDDIERRVRRLLAPQNATARPRRCLASLLALGVAGLTIAGLETVHVILEAAVHGLP